MCLLALFYKVADDAPVVIGANREEYYARGGELPLKYAAEWLIQRRYRVAEHCLVAMRQLCGLREPGKPPICFRAADRGTVSSSLVALRATLADSVYLHAQGSPDRTPYEDYS